MPLGLAGSQLIDITRLEYESDQREQQYCVQLQMG